MKFTASLGFFTAAAALYSVYGQGPAHDEIKSLPGLAVKPTFKQYSGFLNAGPNKRLHYWFAANQNATMDMDPIIIWVNGGPGCSSMLTLMLEHGPFHVVDNGQRLVPNDFSWNKVSNILFLDAPAGSGYSYDATGNYTTNDDQAADDTYLAILDFYQKFPIYSDNSLTIAGQGVAATHVSLVVERLLDEPAINLTGYVINNGVTDERSRANSLMFFAYYHGLFGRSLWKKLTTNCCSHIITQNTCNFVDSTASSCKSAVKEASMIVANQGLNIFNLYSKCERPKNVSDGMSKRDNGSMYHTSRASLLRSLGVSDSDVKWSPPCIDTSAVEAYLNREDVRNALHVQESPLQWKPCSDVLKYKVVYTDLKEIIRKITARKQVRGMLYYGDVDMMSNFLGGKWFVDSLGYETIVAYEQWLKWKQIGGYAQIYDGQLQYVTVEGNQIGGYYQIYDGQLEYVTVKGAGYMVSRDQPDVSLHIISLFIQFFPF